MFTGSIGLHNYVCTVEAMPRSGSAVNFTNSTTTPAGREYLWYPINFMIYLRILYTAPICITEQDVIHFPGQRDVTICINLNVLTDRFENYRFEVVSGSECLLTRCHDQCNVWHRLILMKVGHRSLVTTTAWELKISLRDLKKHTCKIQWQ